MSFIDSILGRATAPEAPQVPNAQSEGNPTPRQPATEPINPLDVYAKMFDTASSEEGPPQFSIDDTVLKDVSGKLNLMSSLDPDLVNNASNGDAKALVALIQAVSQQAYSAALKHSTALTDAHLGRRSEYEQKQTSKQVHNTLTTAALSDIPNSNHPVVKAELSRIAKDLARQNPDASPSAIAEEAKNYFRTLQSAMSPQSSTPAAAQSAGQVDDWEKFLTT